MIFCPKCKSLMIPKEENFICSKCGFKKKKRGSSVVVEKQTEKETVVLEKKIDLLPKTRVECQKCGHNEAYFWSAQTRSADEAETQFFKCKKCKHTWREYR